MDSSVDSHEPGLGSSAPAKDAYEALSEEVMRPVAEVREIGLRSTGMYLPVTGLAMLRLATATAR